MNRPLPFVLLAALAAGTGAAQAQPNVHPLPVNTEADEDERRRVLRRGARERRDGRGPGAREPDPVEANLGETRGPGEQERAAAVVRAGHPLAGRAAPTIGELVRYPWIAPRAGSPLQGRGYEPASSPESGVFRFTAARARGRSGCGAP